MTLRHATWLDCFRLWRWRNHPTTRCMMLHREPIGLLEHLRWFWRVRNQLVVRPTYLWRPDIVQYVALAGRRPVGSGRLDFSDLGLGRVATFDIVIAPQWRGRGYGRTVITLMAAGAEEMGAKTLVADVRRENVASLVAFQRAGFRRQNSVPYACEIVRLVRRCASPPPPPPPPPEMDPGAKF